MLLEIQELAKEGKSIKEISTIIKKSYSYVYKVVKENDIFIPDGRKLYRKIVADEGLCRKFDIKDEEQMIFLYNRGNSMGKIAKIFETTSATVLTILRRNGVKTRLKNGKDNIVPPKLEKSLLEDLYHNKKMSLSEIAIEYGYKNPAAVKNDMVKYNIPRRDYSSASKNLYEMRPELRYEIVQKSGPRNTTSSLEYMFIFWCQDNKVGYEFQYRIDESDILHRYDFYIPKYNLIVEIDGDYWHNQEMIKMKDKIYDEVAVSHGYDIIRFLGSTIKNTKGKCFNVLLEKYDR